MAAAATTAPLPSASDVIGMLADLCGKPCSSSALGTMGNQNAHRAPPAYLAAKAMPWSIASTQAEAAKRLRRCRRGRHLCVWSRSMGRYRAGTVPRPSRRGWHDACLIARACTESPRVCCWHPWCCCWPARAGLRPRNETRLRCGFALPLLPLPRRAALSRDSSTWRRLRRWTWTASTRSMERAIATAA